LELLESFLRGRGRLTEAVSHEVDLSAQTRPTLASWDRLPLFGEPIRITKESDIQAIEAIRLGAFGASSRDRKTLHLGESQTIHVISTWDEYKGSIWITEDRDAYNYARGRDVLARDTFDVLSELVAFGELDRDLAFELSEEIQNAGRPMLRPPASPNDFG